MTATVCADKPAGLPLWDRHPNRAALGRDFAAYVSRRCGQQLAPLHHLPAAASGAVVLAPVEGDGTPPAARSVTGRWCALTPAGQQPAPAPLAPPAPHSAETRAVWREMSTDGGWTRWQAETGLPIAPTGPAGDAPRTPPLRADQSLHLAEVSLTLADGTVVQHDSPAPVAFERLDLLDGDGGESVLRTWLAGLDRRQRLFGPAADHSPDRALRLLHTEDPRVRCDLFGALCWFYWFADQPPAARDLERAASLSELAGASHWTVHWMRNRGQDPQARRRWSSGGPEEWEVEEHGLRYVLSQDRGLSPGLFLDQRQNRRWVLENAAGRRVLNLFAYTGGFGLCATRGGAVEVANVDVGKRALGWARQNFERNGLLGDGVEFRPVDARLFLEGCRKRGRTFDLIVCDPPSFGRSREGVWKIDRDLAGLVQAAVQVLAPGGDLLVSANYERWDQRCLESAVRDAVRGAQPAGRDLALVALPPPDCDFELPGEPPVLKALRLSAA